MLDHLFKGDFKSFNKVYPGSIGKKKRTKEILETSLGKKQMN